MAERRTPIQNVITFRNSQGENARGTLMKLTRSSVVMEVYNPYSIVQLSEVLDDLTIYRGEHSIYRGRAVVSNLVNTGLMMIVSAALVDAWKDLTGLLENGAGIQDEVKHFVDDWKSYRHLRPGYQLVVNDIRSFLIELSRWLEQVDIVYKGGSLENEEEHNSYKELKDSLLPHLSDLYQHFEEQAAEVSNENMVMHKAFVQHELHPLMLQAPYIHRIFTKPLGYAGDYEMMNMIQRDPAEGPTTYAKIINTLFTRIPIAFSVINRTQMLVDYLVSIATKASGEGRGIKTLSVGCGPAIELQRFVREEAVSSGGDFHLLDFSDQALEYAKNQVMGAKRESGRAVDITTIQESVHSLLKKAVAWRQNEYEEGYDFVYCAGLFDYLSDKVCSRLTRLFYSWTKPGGIVLVTNMHPSNNFRYSMEHITEWYLIYRGEMQMEMISPDLNNSKVFKDPTGVNVFLEIRKPVLGKA